MNYSKIRLTAPARVPIDCDIREPEQPRQAIILLHGYSETGGKMLRRLGTVLPQDALILAPNAPFPQVLARNEIGYEIGFSWYFHDPQKDEYFIDMEVALSCLSEVIARKVPAGLRITLIGFSQGGYLAPFVASREASRVKRVIGIGCQFLDEELVSPLGFEIHGIHGEEDDVVNAAVSQRSHEKLILAGARGGTYALLPGVGHRITHEVQAEVARILSD